MECGITSAPVKRWAQSIRAVLKYRFIFPSTSTSSLSSNSSWANRVRDRSVHYLFPVLYVGSSPFALINSIDYSPRGVSKDIIIAIIGWIQIKMQSATWIKASPADSQG